MNKMYLVLGDWSGDGHGISEKVLIESNVSAQEIQEAYKASCKLTGVSFNHNNDYTGIKRSYDDNLKYHVNYIHTLVKTIKKIHPLKTAYFCLTSSTSTFSFCFWLRIWFYICKGWWGELYSVFSSRHYSHECHVHRCILGHRSYLGQTVRIFERNYGRSRFAI